MNQLEILIGAIFLISAFGIACAMIKEIRENKKNKNAVSVSVNRYIVDDIISIEDIKKEIERNPALRERIAWYMI